MVTALRLCSRESVKPVTHTNLRVQVFDGNLLVTCTLWRLLQVMKVFVNETLTHNFVCVTTIKQTRIDISAKIPASW